jgi:ribosome maturation factor RimP
MGTVRYRYAREVDCDSLGRRVSIRRRLPEGGASDVVGTLEACDGETFSVRDKRGRLVTVPRADVVASRVVRAG